MHLTYLTPSCLTYFIQSCHTLHCFVLTTLLSIMQQCDRCQVNLNSECLLNPTGTNLLQVAIHELGHSLGLSHSDVEASIMAPFYSSYNPNIKLHSDDIAGIRRLYGQYSIYAKH